MIHRGIYCPIRSFFPPPPLFWDHFFSPTNKFAAGGAKIFGVYDPKRCIFKAFFPVFLCNFRRISMRQGGAGGVGRPPAKIFEVYNPKRCIFKALFPFFHVIFLPFSFPFLFFSLTLHFHFFPPASHPPPPTIVFCKIYIPATHCIRMKVFVVLFFAAAAAASKMEHQGNQVILFFNFTCNPLKARESDLHPIRIWPVIMQKKIILSTPLSNKFLWNLYHFDYLDLVNLRSCKQWSDPDSDPMENKQEQPWTIFC